jgi:hypothetical protein
MTTRRPRISTGQGAHQEGGRAGHPVRGGGAAREAPARPRRSLLRRTGPGHPGAVKHPSRFPSNINFVSGAFVWVRGVLNSQKRRFPAQAVEAVWRRGRLRARAIAGGSCGHDTAGGEHVTSRAPQGGGPRASEIPDEVEDRAGRRAAEDQNEEVHPHRAVHGARAGPGGGARGADIASLEQAEGRLGS